MNMIGYRVILKRFMALRFMMKDKSVPIWKKLLVVLAVIYVISPIDIIPIAVFPFAWLDDFVLWIWLLWFLRDELDKYWYGEKVVDLSRKFYGKDIVEGVEYEVKSTEDRADNDKTDRDRNDDSDK